MTSRHQWTVADLKNAPSNAFFFCPECFFECSAKAGDYFAAAPDTVLTCCDTPMRLVTRQTVYQDIKAPR